MQIGAIAVKVLSKLISESVGRFVFDTFCRCFAGSERRRLEQGCCYEETYNTHLPDPFMGHCGPSDFFE